MNESRTGDDLILSELKKISKILMLSNAPIIEIELSKIVISDSRKKIWVLINGKRMPKDLARETGVTQMAVSKFLSTSTTAELIEYTQREPPSKILDYVPPSWIELVKITEKEEKKESKVHE